MRPLITAVCILFALVSSGCANLFRDALCRVVEDPTGEMYLNAAFAHEGTGGVVWVLTPRTPSAESPEEPWEAFLVFADDPPVAWELNWQLPPLEGLRRSGLPRVHVGPRSLFSSAGIAGTRPDILGLTQLPPADRDKVAGEVEARADEWMIDPEHKLAWRRALQIPTANLDHLPGFQPAIRYETAPPAR